MLLASDHRSCFAPSVVSKVFIFLAKKFIQEVGNGAIGMEYMKNLSSAVYTFMECNVVKWSR